MEYASNISSDVFCNFTVTTARCDNKLYVTINDTRNSNVVMALSRDPASCRDAASQIGPIKASSYPASACNRPFESTIYEFEQITYKNH